MTINKRAIAVALVAVAVVAGAAAEWRLNGQHVNVVVINASGTPVQFEWQPAPFAETVSVDRSGCESSSMDLRAGEGWRLSREGETILDSSAVSVPLLAGRVAVEVWLGADQSVRIEPAREVEAPVGAPYPRCDSAVNR